MTDTAIAIEYAKEAAEGERMRKAAEEREAVEEIVAKKKERNSPCLVSTWNHIIPLSFTFSVDCQIQLTFHSISEIRYSRSCSAQHSTVQCAYSDTGLVLSELCCCLLAGPRIGVSMA
jgi:hypothetical protein